MRPPPSLLLTMVTSLLMTSSSVMAVAPIPTTLKSECPDGDNDCMTVRPVVDPNGGIGAAEKIECEEGYVLEQDVLIDAVLTHPPNEFKAVCYSKCHKKFRVESCPAGVPPAECKTATQGSSGEFQCGVTHDLLINGVVADSFAECDKKIGWTDKKLSPIVDFSKDDHHVVVSCKVKPPLPPPPPNPNTVKDGCTQGEQPCDTLTQISKDENGKKTGVTLSCNTGFVLETSIVDDAALEYSAKLQGTCYSKCNRKYRQNKCPTGIPPAECKKAAFDPNNDKYFCDATHDLMINGVQQSSATCYNDRGWTDSDNNIIVNFNGDDHHVVIFCKEKPPTPPPPCGPNSYEDECTSCAQHPTYDAAKKLTCPAGSRLMYGSKLLDNAECVDTPGAETWNGFETDQSTQEVLLDLVQHPQAKLRVQCFTLCSQQQIECSASTPGCKIPTLTGTTLSCAAHTDTMLEVDGSFYKDATCSDAGWQANSQVLLNLKKNPFAKLQATCQPYASMFENDCPKGLKECEQQSPKYSANKLKCLQDHYLIVDGKPYEELTLSGNGWTTTGAAPQTVLDYSNNKIEKLKARCLSKCHPRFINTDCASPCNKPIYDTAGQTLFCKNADEELFLETVKVPDVVCDVAKKGWKTVDADATTAPIFKFAQYTGKEVKAVCTKKPATPPPVVPPVQPTTTTPSPTDPPVKNATVPTPTPAPVAAASTGMQPATYIMLALVVVLVLVVGGLSMCVWRLKKKQSDDDDDDNEMKSKTKSVSKNNSSKKKSGKKGKKNSKNSEKKKKKGKKGKKEKEKPKKVKKTEEDVDDNVEIPDHQMSEPHSTLALTAALAAVDSPPNGNLVDV